MMNTVKIVPTLLLASLILFGCRKIEVYPVEPQITFKSIVLNDSSDVLGNPVKYVTLTFDVVDGDGDIGLDESDTTGPFHRDSLYYYNLFIKEYEKVGDQYLENTNLKFPRNYRIPDLTPTGQNKTLKASVSVEMEYRYSETNQLPLSQFKYFYYLVDRSLNKSNIDTSTLVVF